MAEVARRQKVWTQTRHICRENSKYTPDENFVAIFVLAERQPTFATLPGAKNIMNTTETVSGEEGQVLLPCLCEPGSLGWGESGCWMLLLIRAVHKSFRESKFKSFFLVKYLDCPYVTSEGLENPPPLKMGSNDNLRGLLPISELDNP